MILNTRQNNKETQVHAARLTFLPAAATILIWLTAVTSSAIHAAAVSSLPDTDVVATKPERVPTEELVEGIKSSDGRWFEVELILFERQDNLDLREQFDQNVPNLNRRDQWDLLQDLLAPDLSMWLAGLPHCLAHLDPLNNHQETGSKKAQLTPDAFWQAFQDYQGAIRQDWQFEHTLCLTSRESLPDFWRWYLEIPNEALVLNQEIRWQHMMPRPTGPDHDDYHSVYLLAPQNLQLMEQYKLLQLNGKTRPLLHIGWRQPGLSKRRAKPMYLRAGKNYTESFRYDGSPILEKAEDPKQQAPDASDFSEENANSNSSTIDMPAASASQLLAENRVSQVEQFMQKLRNGAQVDFKSGRLIQAEQDNLPTETWELDGYVTVHLNHYLFLEAEFNFRQKQMKMLDPADYLDQLDSWTPSQEASGSTNLDSAQDNAVVISAFQQASNFGEIDSKASDNLIQLEFLQNYPFKQTRRTYSGDLHYLDHPKLGVLFQIRKYRH